MPGDVYKSPTNRQEATEFSDGNILDFNQGNPNHAPYSVVAATNEVNAAYSAQETEHTPSPVELRKLKFQEVMKARENYILAA